jgi:hypothetical protein
MPNEERVREICDEIARSVNAGSEAAYRNNQRFVVDADKLYISFARAIAALPVQVSGEQKKSLRIRLCDVLYPDSVCDCWKGENCPKATPLSLLTKIERAIAASPPAPAQVLTDGERAAVSNLREHQEQCDMDGAMVKVSRQAVDEVLAIIDRITNKDAEHG